MEVLIPPLGDSPLALSRLQVASGAEVVVFDEERDSLLYIAAGEGSLVLEGSHDISAGSATLVQAGERVELATTSELDVVHATVDPSADRHAPLGPREYVVQAADAAANAASGARSFQILFGPHNGSTRATLFLGYIPPGRAPWHYHLYDEIVWLPEGPGTLHSGAREEELGGGSAFRLRPREVHIVENVSTDTELVILGVFTPAGSPSAAYLTPDVAADYAFSS